MIVYTEGKIIASTKEEFVDREGVQVEFFVNVLKTVTGISTINSKKSYTQYEEVSGVVGLRVTEDSERKNRFKISLASFAPNSELMLPEADVE